MKKIIILIIMISLFLIGIKVGNGYSISDSNLFESEKNKFESEITNPNNDYQAEKVVIEEGITNKVAHKIEGTIEKIINKILKIVE